MVHFLAGLPDIEINLLKKVPIFVLKLNIIRSKLLEVSGDLFGVKWKSDRGSTYPYLQVTRTPRWKTVIRYTTLLLTLEQKTSLVHVRTCKRRTQPYNYAKVTDVFRISNI
jgi:hypothetical protein